MHYRTPNSGDVRMGLFSVAILLAVVIGGSCLAVYGLAVLAYRGWVL